MTEVALAVPWRGGRVLVARRAAGSHLEGLWEFPGGKIADGEEPAAAAARELREETGLVAVALEPLTVFHYAYPDRDLRLHVFLARDPEGEPRVDGGRDWAWVETERLGSLPMPEANRAILRSLSWRCPR